MGMARVLERFSLRQILLVSFAAAVIRFVTIGCWPSITCGCSWQRNCFTGWTFGSFHSAAIAAINRWFQGNTRSRGQALYSSFCAVRRRVGGLVSGWAWERFGSGAAFAAGSLFALVGLLRIARAG